MNKDKINGEGYKDLTAYNAMKSIEKNEKNNVKLLSNEINILIGKYGFELINCVELRSKSSGNNYIIDDEKTRKKR